ncbi:unnamed protein product [marine sediment metagenome]|uniref:Outer membrane protein beta-barrel domain-containing protein n=1 Tax=marine sediment metagenome TaxID=412755 RepID=X1H970_9ZZZZ
MKKVTVFMMILTVGVVFTCTLTAQGITAKGVKGGLNMAKFTGDDAELETADPGYLLAYSFGGFVTYKVNDQLTIQPEFLYTVKGSKYEESEEYSEDGVDIKSEVKMDLKMNWLEIPVLAVFQLQDNIKLFAGPYIGLYLSGEMEMEYEYTVSYEGVTESDSDSESEDIEKEDVNSPGFGLVFGGSYSVNSNIAIEARYTLGLKTIDKEPEDWDDGEYEVSDIKNSVIQLLVSYSF